MADPPQGTGATHDPGSLAAEVRAELARILASRQFIHAPSLSRLLEYVVECSLAGEADRLKEFTLGVHVFDRGAGFDPRADTIVRVQGRRLRKKLGEFYREHGVTGGILIEVPKGHYAPRLSRVDNRPARSTRAGEAGATPRPGAALPAAGWYPPRWPFVSALALVLVAAAVAWWAPRDRWRSPDPGPHRVVGGEAQHHYLQGQFFFNRRGEGDLHRAEARFQQALQADAEFARAWAGLAGVQMLLVAEGAITMDVGLAAQREAIDRALAIDPDLPEAHVRAALHFSLVGDDERAVQHLDRAGSLAPDEPLYLGVMAGRALRDGDPEQAIALQRRVATLDPLSTIAHSNLGHKLMYGGRWAEAEASFRTALALSPERADTLLVDIGRTLIGQQRFEEALELFAGLPDGAQRDAGLALALIRLGRLEEADVAMQRLVDDEDIAACLLVAELHAARGEAEPAFARLHHAYAFAETLPVFNRDRVGVRNARYAPFYEPLHADGRWHDWVVLAGRL